MLTCLIFLKGTWHSSAYAVTHHVQIMFWLCNNSIKVCTIIVQVYTSVCTIVCILHWLLTGSLFKSGIAARHSVKCSTGRCLTCAIMCFVSADAFKFADSTKKCSDVGQKIVGAPLSTLWLRPNEFPLQCWNISLQILQAITNLPDKLSWSSKLAELGSNHYKSILPEEVFN